MTTLNPNTHTHLKHADLLTPKCLPTPYHIHLCTTVTPLYHIIQPHPHIIITSSLPHPPCHTLATITTPIPPHYTLTSSHLIPPHPHHHTLTATLSPPHPHHHTSPSHPHIITYTHVGRFNSNPTLSNRYLLLHLIGRGGFSEVYQVRCVGVCMCGCVGCVHVYVG